MKDITKSATFNAAWSLRGAALVVALGMLAGYLTSKAMIKGAFPAQDWATEVLKAIELAEGDLQGEVYERVGSATQERVGGILRFTMGRGFSFMPEVETNGTLLRPDVLRDEHRYGLLVERTGTSSKNMKQDPGILKRLKCIVGRDNEIGAYIIEGQSALKSDP